MRYAIVDRAAGDVLTIIEADTIENVMLNCPDGADPHPCASPDILPGGWVWRDGKFAKLEKPLETLDQANDRIIRAVKMDADRRKLAVVTALPFKTAEYSGKAGEVAAWDAALGAGIIGTVAQTLTAIDEWSTPRRSATFPWAIADAKAHGDTLDKAIGRFRAGMSAPRVTAYDIAGAEAVTCTAVRAAKTIAAKEAAAAAAPWPA